MRAVRVRQFGGPEVLKVEEIAEPSPGPGQVLIRVKAVGVNPVETYIRTGTHAQKPALPYTPGNDAAGELVAFGEGASRPDLKVGSRVWCCRSVTGTYAEMVVCDLKSVAPLPARVSFEQGAGVGVPYLTAYQAVVHKAQLKAGETILVHGASGGVGLAAVQIARAIGALVIGSAGTEKGMELVKAEGAHAAVNHREAGYEERIKQMTGGRGVDVVIEMLANVNLQRDAELAASRGRIVVVGSRGSLEFNPRALMSKDLTVLGLQLHNATDHEWTRMQWAVNEGLNNGTLRPVVGKVLKLEEAAKAHELVMESGAGGKIVMTV